MHPAESLTFSLGEKWKSQGKREITRVCGGEGGEGLNWGTGQEESVGGKKEQCRRKDYSDIERKT